MVGPTRSLAVAGAVANGMASRALVQRVAELYLGGMTPGTRKVGDDFHVVLGCCSILGGGDSGLEERGLEFALILEIA